MPTTQCDQSVSALPVQPLLSVQGVSLTLSQRRILQDINLELKTGEFLGLIGPNGGGKTSLLRVILGVLEPTSGQVIWRDPVTGGRPSSRVRASTQRH